MSDDQIPASGDDSGTVPTCAAVALDELLTQELSHAVEHGATADGGAMSTHLPMALHALAALGASAERLQAWARTHFPTVPSAPSWPALAEREAELLAAMAREGPRKVLAQCLPGCLAHAGAMAFHVLIRMAHMWEAGHRHQLARALAYASLREMPMPALMDGAASGPRPAADNRRDGLAWTVALVQLPQPAQQPPWISLRMQAAAERADVQAVAASLCLPGDSRSQLHQLGRWAARAYADSGNFTLLHALTATRAFTRLLTLLPAADHAQAIRAFRMPLAAAVVASRWTGQTRPAPPDSDWPALRAAALAHEDEHAIKAVHAAWDLGAVIHQDADPVWRQAAARALTSFA